MCAFYPPTPSLIPPITKLSRLCLRGFILSAFILLWIPLQVHAQSPCDNPYIVQSGDTFSQIARRCEVPFDDLRTANPQIDNIHRLEIGDRINLPGQPNTESPRPSIDTPQLANATIVLVGAATGNVTRRNGSARIAVEGGILEVDIVGPTVAGDINGDGADDIVTVTREHIQNTTGKFYTLHALVSGDGDLTDIGHEFLGDRITVNSIEILSDGAIRVDMFAKRPTDPGAGATLHVIRTYRLHLGKLVLIQELPGSGIRPTVTPTPTPATPTPVPTVPPPSANGCDYPTRLQRGTLAHVAFYPPAANTVRNAPSPDGAEIGRIQPGVVVNLLDGPRCADGWQWWYVQAESGERGWTSEGRSGEYWLAPGHPTDNPSSSVDSITFCTQVDRSRRCLDPATDFASPLYRLEVNWQFRNLPVNSYVHHRWYRNGQLYHDRDNVLWEQNRSAINGFAQTYYAPGGAFRTGQWRLDFINAADGQVLGSGYFSVSDGDTIDPNIGQQPTANFGGVWQTNFAEVAINQAGNRVSGSYVRYSDPRVVYFSGTVEGRTLRARTSISQTPFHFEMNASSSQIDGEWFTDGGRGYPWCGVRSGALPPGCGFSGVWNSTPTPYGWVELVQTGSTVSGRYYNGATWGSLSGDFDLRGPNASYSLAGTYQAEQDPANDRGRFRISLIDLDSSQFQGCWRNTVTQNVGNWCGWQGSAGGRCPQVDRCE